MTQAEVEAFLAQFQKTNDHFATWPDWLKKIAVVRSASLPKSGSIK